MPSIRQNPGLDRVPDFRNLGVMARILVGVNALAFAGAIYAGGGWAQALQRFVEAAVVIEPLLLASLAALYALAGTLGRLPYRSGALTVMALVLALAAAMHALAISAGMEPGESLSRTLVLAALVAAALLAYFRLLTKAYSPALGEARLQALQARIRPHFLFNSLNAVLSLIRRDPQRAERALEDLADLFRVLMSDGRGFVRLADEIELLERYAGVEQLRLGERLLLTWELDSAPMDALLPPLVLQPLLENAIYHGVEPGTGTSDVLVRIERRGSRVHALIENPAPPPGTAPRAGNHMAQDNIRERLMLFFDADASLQAGARDGRYRVELDMPYRADRS